MNDLTKFLVDGILKEETQGITVMIPGGFKPPHEGHLMLAKGYSSMPSVSKVVILITPKEREGITVQDSKSIWNTLLMGTKGIEVREVTYPSPLTAAYEFVKNDGKEGDVFALGASSKGDDYSRVADFVRSHQEGGKYFKPGVSVVELPFESSRPLVYRGRTDDKNGSPISASQLRADLAAGDFANFKTNYPSVKVPSQIQTIYDLLKKNKLTERVIIESQITDFTQKLRGRFKLFIQSIAKEGRLTKEAFYLMGQAALGKKQLTPKEKEKIGNQMKEALKSAGLIAATLLPGGMIYFIIIRLLKLENYIVPNSFAGKNSASIAMIAEHKLLTEGGAAGHMAHPFEDLELTFADAKNMIDAALSGKVEFAQEKLDGQNLMMTYKDGQALSARKKSQFANAAEKAYTKSQFMQSGGDWPENVKTAFFEAFNDMATMMEKLSPQDKEKFFENGKKFVNFEIIYPGTTNVVPYGSTQIRLHGFKEYDQAGNVVDEDSNAGIQLQKAIENVQASNQKTYEIRVTDPITLNKTKDYEKQKSELLTQLDTIRKSYNLGEQEKMSTYFQAWWKDYIEQKGKELGYEVPDNTLQLLVSRWGFGDKSTNITKLRKEITSEEFSAWVDQFDRGGLAVQQQKVAKVPIENLFLKLGVYVLQNIEKLVSLNPNDVVQQIRNDLAGAIRGIRSAAASTDMQDDGKSLQFLRRELQKLQDLGGYESIVPLEGVVFKYNDKIYKLTGAFAPINQIIGYIKYGRK